MTRREATARRRVLEAMSRAEAIAALVERDVRRWGEGERAASVRRWESSTHGGALNSLGSALVIDGDEETGERLMREAEPLLTDADHDRLRSGG
jgi:hypothetical protein